jgi:hypothetical protein
MPSLELQPSEGTVGAEVKAIGTGFRPNVSYRIQLESEWLKPGTMNNRGGFVAIFRIPPAPYGERDILAVSQAAHQLAHATFKVVPHITRVGPEKIKAGDNVTVSGAGFGSGEPIQIHVNDQPVILDAETSTNSDGTFTASFVATGDVIRSTPVSIRVTGQQTGALAET